MISKIKKDVSNIAIAYVRVSQDSQDETTQIDSVKKYAENNKFILTDICIEKKSASVDPSYANSDLALMFKNRPKILKLLTKAQNKEFSKLIVYSSDRLARDIGQNAFLKFHFNKNNVEIHFSKEGEHFSQDPLSQKLQNLLACFAEYEASLIGTRIYDMQKQKLENGYWPSPKVPYGYKIENKKLTKDGKNSVHTKEIFSFYAEGWGYRTIASELRKITNSPNFTKSTVERIIKNKTYFGTVTWGKKASKRKRAKGLSSTELYAPYNESIDIASKSNKNLIGYLKNYKKNIKDPKFFSTPYILKDLLICSQCNKKMLPKNYGGSKSSVYRCPTSINNKSHNIIKVKDIEAIILEKLKPENITEEDIKNSYDKYLDKFNYEQTDLKDEKQRLKKEKKFYDKQIKNIKAMLGTSDLSDDLINGLKKYRLHFTNLLTEIESLIVENNKSMKNSSPIDLNNFYIKVKGLMNEIPNKRMLCFLLIDKVLLDADTKEVTLHLDPKIL